MNDKEMVGLHISRPVMERARALSKVSGISLSKMAESGIEAQLTTLDLSFTNWHAQVKACLSGV